MSAHPALPAAAMPPRAQPAQVGLWVFMAVVGVLFALFAAAYLMRMASGDWRALPVIPWQLGLSTALLAASSVAWARARKVPGGAAARACLAAGLWSVAFLAAQLWAWQAMHGFNFTVAGNPANSFFYLLTGLHGAHVLGGLLAAALVARRLARGRGTAARVGVALCAQYWHFLLGLWLALFGLLFFVTPELVQRVCGF